MAHKIHSNAEAIRFTSEQRREEIAARLADYYDDDLLNLYREANSYWGDFEFVDTFDPEEIGEFVSDPYEVLRATVYGSVDNVNDPLRFNAYGNLESVSEFDIIHEAKDYISDLIPYIIDSYEKFDSIYDDDETLLEKWWELDSEDDEEEREDIIKEFLGED